MSCEVQGSTDRMAMGWHATSWYVGNTDISSTREAGYTDMGEKLI